MSSTAKTPTQTEPAEESLALYRRMLLIREFEDRVQSLFLKGEVYGTTHLYSGQEAVAVAVSSALEEGDLVAGTYRGHGHSLGLGLSAEGLLAELLGRATGVCGGRAGSMNVIDLEHGLIGCFGIVGGSIAAATGAAFALKRRGGVAVAYFGDGAMNQAYVYECMNFAQVYRLPLLLVCENNLYGEYTLSAAVTAGTILSRPEAMEVSCRAVDGNDVWAVREAALEAVAHARAGEGPTFLEARTYRFVGHSRSDPGKYRPEGELERQRELDPLVVARTRLAGEHGVAEQMLDDLARSVAEELDAAQAAALAAPWPDPAQPVTQYKE
jgi:TPP-dependent pyruvate/acetoin dehydrogenase alpha subunit